MFGVCFGSAVECRGADGRLRRTETDGQNRRRHRLLVRRLLVLLLWQSLRNCRVHNGV